MPTQDPPIDSLAPDGVLNALRPKPPIAFQVIINFVVVEVVFILLRLVLVVRQSALPGEALADVFLTAVVYVPLVFGMSLLVLVPVLRAWHRRSWFGVNAMPSWLPGATLGVVLYVLDRYTMVFHLFTPIARALWP